MSEIEDRLRKGARAIYLATESIVADDVSDMMNKAADEIVSLRAKLAEAVGLLNAAHGFVQAAPIKHPQQGPVKVDLLEAICAVVSRHREQGGE